MDKFRIVMSGPLGHGQVYRNGDRIDRVMAVEFRAKPGDLNTVTLTFAASEVEIEGDGQIVYQGEVAE